jgi:hypothetical protein
MKGILLCSLCALATLTLGWGWQQVTQTIQPASTPSMATAATAATVGTLGSMAELTTGPRGASGLAARSGFPNASILATTHRSTASSEIAGTLPVVGLIGLLAFGGAVGLQVARRRV